MISIFDRPVGTIRHAPNPGTINVSILHRSWSLNHIMKNRNINLILVMLSFFSRWLVSNTGHGAMYTAWGGLERKCVKDRQIGGIRESGRAQAGEAQNSITVIASEYTTILTTRPHTHISASQTNPSVTALEWSRWRPGTTAHVNKPCPSSINATQQVELTRNPISLSPHCLSVFPFHWKKRSLKHMQTDHISERKNA